MGQIRPATYRRIRAAVQLLQHNGGTMKRAELIKKLMASTASSYAESNNAVHKMTRPTGWAHTGHNKTIVLND